jgi:hypothetical protein
MGKCILALLVIMYQIEVSGPFHVTALILLGKQLLVPIEYEDGWATEIVWMIQGSESLALAANCAVYPALSIL